MNNIHYIQCFVGGFLGVTGHVFIKIAALKTRSRVGNVKFSIAEYFTDDWPSIILSLLCVLIVMFVLDEIIADNPCIADNLKWFFITIGYTGSSTLQAWLGKSGKKINEVIDAKTDIADGKIN